MGYLQAVGAAFAGIAKDAGLRVRFQVGEPWWWVMPDGRFCLYDDAAKAALGGDPVAIDDVHAAMNPAQIALLDAAGALLADSTAALADAVRAVAADAELLLLLYLPIVLAAPELKRALAPTGWASPAFDVLQLEDYDWVIAGDTSASARGAAEMTARLGYSPERQHYFAGFVLRPEEALSWGAIEAALGAARTRGVAQAFVWALPQVARDGFTYFETGESEVDAFDDVSFPIAIGREAKVEATTSTAIAAGAGGAEQRNSEWAEARLKFDAGPGVRSEADLAALIAFFRARRGAAKAFRFRDPFDDSSNGMTGEVGPLDQALGTGDGVRVSFPLVKDYDGAPRRITRPVPGSVRVAVAGAEMTAFTLDPLGVLVLDQVPPEGAVVTAGYRFDVPVRFGEDRLEVSRATFLAGEAMSVALIEVRE